MSILKRIFLILLSLFGVFLVSCGGTFLVVISNLHIGNGSSSFKISELIGTIVGIALLIFSVYLAFLTFKKFFGPTFAYFCLGIFGLISASYGFLILFTMGSNYIINDNTSLDLTSILISLSLVSAGCYSLWVIYKKRKEKKKGI